MSEKNPLHAMKLHDVLHPEGQPLLQIQRVPGGWIYTNYQEEYRPLIDRIQTNYLISSIFVPYSDEFDEKA